MLILPSGTNLLERLAAAAAVAVAVAEADTCSYRPAEACSGYDALSSSSHRLVPFAARTDPSATPVCPLARWTALLATELP